MALDEEIVRGDAGSTEEHYRRRMAKVACMMCQTKFTPLGRTNRICAKCRQRTDGAYNPARRHGDVYRDHDQRGRN